MTDPREGAPLIWNVAGLLGEDAGAWREFDVEGVQFGLDDEELSLAKPITGHVRFRRTNRGILADAQLTASLATECSRCLRPMELPVEVSIEEEFLPALDMATGKPLPTEAEPDVARLTDHHEVDLTPLVRDELLLAVPFAPLHDPNCPGLCPICGLPLDEGVHDHPEDDIDPRLEALRAFKPNDEAG